MSQAQGYNAEELIALKYKQKGFTIIAQNFQFYTQRKKGEIDIIAFKNNVLHLVEVKFRTGEFTGNIILQIQVAQMHRINLTYQYFLKKFPQYRSYNVQIDLALVTPNGGKVIPNAWSLN
jgi:putative endonuclease